MINNFFDKVYCLNLDSRDDRWQQCLQQFQKHNLTVERVSAINGHKLNLNIPGVKPGAIGCSLSHQLAIRLARQNQYNSVMILEDDVEFADDLQQQFSEYVNQMPDNWDIIYFGGNHQNPIIPVSANVSRIQFSYAAHAVAFRHTVYDMLLEFSSNLQVAVDVAFAHAQYRSNAFVFTPHLAWQRDSFSDIEQTDVSYQFLKNHIQ